MTKFIIVHQYIGKIITDELRDIYVNVDEISNFQDGEIELKNGDRIDLLKEKAEEIMEMIND